MILRAEGLALRRGWVFRGAQRCGKVGNIVSKWKLCDERGNRATCAGVGFAQVKVLRVKGNVQCTELVGLVTCAGEREDK